MGRIGSGEWGVRRVEGGEWGVESGAGAIVPAALSAQTILPTSAAWYYVTHRLAACSGECDLFKPPQKGKRGRTPDVLHSAADCVRVSRRRGGCTVFDAGVADGNVARGHRTWSQPSLGDFKAPALA